MNLSRFKKTIWTYYRKHGRHDLPWRKTKDPYKILVSEVMLQQTQVNRVIEKYKSFLQKFPTVEALAKAPLKDVLLEWQGLGYNRRAKYLKLCAEKVIHEHGGIFPKTVKGLTTLPGIGPATAGDILAFAYNIPVPVIETNIRSVFIHFFKTSTDEPVHDRDLLPLIEKALDIKNPREWYWALFDYGAYLKNSKIKNPNHKSNHYVKQSPFKGSNREKRSQILKLILTGARSEKEITKALGYETEVVQRNLKQMVTEDLIKRIGAKYSV